MTMNAPDDWNDHAKLLDYGFAAYEEEVAAEAGECVGSIPVIGGAEEAVKIEAAGKLCCAVLPSEQCQLRLELPAFVYAPVEAGDALGRAVLWLDGKMVAAVDVVCSQGVAAVYEKPRWYEWLLSGPLGRLQGR